ncbi:MAG: serine hydrolase [Clostridiaceae bacterium]|nr:serine hydrolase [Clostridiaceae bacterium]
MDKELTAKLSRIIEYGLPEKWTSVSYALSVGGVTIAADALGRQGGKSGARANTDCTYNVASISKIYCTAAVMQLCEQGKLSLDTPVCEYLPRFWMPDERYHDITLRHCLNHSSGLPGTLWKQFSVTELTGDYYDIVYDYCAKNRLKAAPGAFSVYCNDGFTLAEMAVAAAAGQPYDEYIREHITEPIGAHSTRSSRLRDRRYTLVCDRQKHPELLNIAGAGGLTTTMTDLCAFGNLFLHKNNILSEESKREMGRPQGVTFLPGDDASVDYGLGWDNVNYVNADFDLGEHVLRKGGNSFQMSSQLMIVPAYDAVIAISQTHDCDLPLVDTALRMLATALAERGICIARRGKPVPAGLENRAGTYLTKSTVLELFFYGCWAELIARDSTGKRRRECKTFCWDGEKLENAEKQVLGFADAEGDSFLMLTESNGRTAPYAQRALPQGKLSVAWKKRVGKGYLPVDFTAYDLVAGEICCSLRLRRLKGSEGVLLACFPALSDTGSWETIDCPFAPMDDMVGNGFLRIPNNGGRDAVTPVFEKVGDTEYCTVASYRYRDISLLPAWKGQRFARSGGENRAFVLDAPLTKLPRIPGGRRILVYDEQLLPVYDSLAGGEYKPVKAGYILLI